MSQNYGVLRIVRVRLPSSVTSNLQRKYPGGWIPEERLVHLLTRSETTIGRALNNDILLMDPTVSREHARLIYDENGWRVFNLTAQNTVRVNGRSVPVGGSLPIKPQDFLVLGSTMLQLIAPQPELIEVRDAPAIDVPTRQLPALFPETSTRVPSLPSDKLDGHNSGLAKVPPTLGGTGEQSWRPDTASLTPDFPASVAGGSEDPPLFPWEEAEEENLLGIGVTMQFAFPQRMGTHTRWLIGGVGTAILTVSALFTFVINSLIGISVYAKSGPSSLVAALIVPLIPALAIILLVNFIDRFEREPWFLRLGAFLWGAIIAIPPARIIEQYVVMLLQGWLGDADILVNSLFFGLNAGIPEETFKGLGLLLLYFFLHDEFDNITDGIVYGALIGAGFAMVENFDYFARNSKDFFWFLIVGRVMLGWLSHSTFIICFGIALGAVRHARKRWQRIIIPLAGYLLAIVLHSTFDFVHYFANGLVISAPNPDTNTSTLAVILIIADYIPPFIAQIVILYFLLKSLAHEAAIIREFLANEVSNAIVRVEEYVLLQTSFQRTKYERQVLQHSGLKQWLRVKALYQTEIGLAFRKWHVSMGDQPKPGDIQPEDAYRQRIRRLRQEIIEAEAKKQTAR
jgi:RsiW-degrading membrane proteinase PrsW (M82 family)/pSer/pThr/pTyr-binding forkhead associated (FHA) protein